MYVCVHGGCECTCVHGGCECTCVHGGCECTCVHGGCECTCVHGGCECTCVHGGCECTCVFMVVVSVRVFMVVVSVRVFMVAVSVHDIMFVYVSMSSTTLNSLPPYPQLMPSPSSLRPLHQYTDHSLISSLYRPPPSKSFCLVLLPYTSLLQACRVATPVSVCQGWLACSVIE